MFSDVRDGKEVTRRGEANPQVKTHRLLTGVTPKKGTLVLFDHRKGGAEKGGGKALTLVFWKCRHSPQSVLVGFRKAFTAFEVERGYTYELFFDEGPEVESEFVVVTLENAILKRAVRSQHLLTEVVSVDGLDS